MAGLIWSEIKQLWDVGLKEYVSDMWNVVDFITNSLYVATIGLRLRAYYDVSLGFNLPHICGYVVFLWCTNHIYAPSSSWQEQGEK